MKAVSKPNLNTFSAKLKAWIKARKIKASDLDSGSATAGQIPTADGSGGVSYQDPSGGITQEQADARYLQLSGGTMTGEIKINTPSGSIIRDANNYNVLESFGGTTRIGHNGGNITLETPDIDLRHTRSNTQYNILDSKNTSANPALAGSEAALESLKLNGVKYKNQPSSMQILTTAPTADNTSGIKIVVLSSEPATKYNGYLYLITASNS